MRDLQIRRARPEDLAALIQQLGQRRFFVDRLNKQSDGLGVLLTAWRAGIPVGDVYLWLEDAEEPEIREHLPGTPLLTHLEILDDHRGQGIGTALVQTAEHELSKQGHEGVALAVELNNADAARLYTRLGFTEWPHPPVDCYSLGDGNGHRRIERCRIMVKRLAR